MEYHADDSHNLGGVVQIFSIENGADIYIAHRVLCEEFKEIQSPDFSSEKNRNNPYALYPLTQITNIHEKWILKKKIKILD
jgi:hypothetical protein